MKRYLSSISCLLIVAYGFALIGCGPSQAQVTAEQSFYASKVMIAKQASSQPIFEMTASDSKQPIVLQNVSAFRVFQASSSSGNDGLAQYVHRDYAAPWINLLGSTLSVALPWYGAYKMVGAIADVIPKTGNATTLTNTINGDGNTQTNKTQIAGDLQLNASGNSGTMALPGTLGNIVDQTSTPTVVNQPAPLVVTQPAPVIVEQPQPVIVTQPAPVIVEPTPVIVQPSYPPAPVTP
jgi:hypothetical protein